MIIQTIIEILKTEESVFINDLGQFSKHFVSAQLTDGMLYPPQYLVKFNPNSDGNGFAFTLKLSEKLQKRIPEADGEVKQWVEKLKAAVLNNKSVSFQNFGTFYLNSKGELGFDSTNIVELNSEYEGMEPIEIKALEKEEVVPETVSSGEQIKEDVAETISDNIQPSPAPAPEIPEVKNVAVAAETSDETKIMDEEKEKTLAEPNVSEGESEAETSIPQDNISVEKESKPKKKNRKVAIILTIILVILLGLGAIGYFYWVPIELTVKDIMHQYFSKEPIQTEKVTEGSSEFDIFNQLNENGCCNKEVIVIPFLPGYEQDSDTSAVEKETLSAGEVNSSEEAPVLSPSTTEFSKTLFQKGKYYVIAGSFISEKDAALHIKERSLQHLNPILLYQDGNNRIRVCVGIYNSEQEANDFVNKINRNYWVLK